jgi:hypothetical protein
LRLSGEVGFVAELVLPAAAPPSEIMAAPVTLYRGALPERLTTYSFRFKDLPGGGSAAYRLYRMDDPYKFYRREGDRLVRLAGSPGPPSRKNFVASLRPVRSGGVTTLVWDGADQHPDGWYYLAVAVPGSGEVRYGVVFSHQTRPDATELAEASFQRFKDAVGKVINYFNDEQRQLKVIEMPQAGGMRPVSYTGARGLLVYRAEDVEKILKDGRDVLDVYLRIRVYAGIREYMDKEYPSGDELPTFPDPRDGSRRLVSKSEGDRVLSRALAALKNVALVPSGTVSIDIRSSLPEEVTVKLFDLMGKPAGIVITDGKLPHLTRKKYIVWATKPGYQRFRYEINLMNTNQETSINCMLYAEGNDKNTSRCTHPQ